MSQGSEVRSATTPAPVCRRVVATALALLAPLVAWPSAVASATAARGRIWHVDCSAAADGDGSARHPLADLAAASQVVLGPGDELRLRRGTVCRGSLSRAGEQGSGAAGRPLVIGAYGPPGASRPVIDGDGAFTSVQMTNVSHIVVEGLELTNSGGDAGSRHRGVSIVAAGQVVDDVTVRDLRIHDIAGPTSFTESAKRGGGIIAETSNGGRFAGMLVERNRIHDVSRSGIFMAVGSGSRPPADGAAWAGGGTGFVARGNIVERVQGDGIVVRDSVGAVLERNVVRVGNLAGRDFRVDSRSCAAGIWTWNANRTVIQFNEVSNMRYGPSSAPGALDGCDGTGYNLDYNQDGTVIQYNLSHHNDGGFMLLCAADSIGGIPRPRRAEIRYNLSVDDAATFSPTPCTAELLPGVNNLDGVRFYNNTIVAEAPRVTMQLDESLALVMRALGIYGDFEFRNNVVHATGPDAAAHFFSCGVHCSHNVFSGIPVPSGATDSLTSDPSFIAPVLPHAGPRPESGFRLRGDSPALHAGVSVPEGIGGAAGCDYFGIAVGDPPTIGFAESMRRRRC